jgi:hypothetical protein
VLLVLSACGRVGFDAASDGVSDGGNAGADAVALDGLSACTGAYQATATQVLYRVAELSCAEVGGSLVTVNDDTENLNLVGVAGILANGEDGVWIGLNDRLEEGTFEWVGEDSPYRKFVTGQPNDGGAGTTEDCVSLMADGWRDEDCDDVRRGFICQCDDPS